MTYRTAPTAADIAAAIAAYRKASRLRPTVEVSAKSVLHHTGVYVLHFTSTPPKLAGTVSAGAYRTR